MGIIKNSLKSTLFVLIVLFVSFSTASADVINVPSDYDSIQEAIDFSKDGDTVLVAPGVYFESLNYNGKLITVISSDGPLITVITNDPDVDLVVFTNGEASDAILDGFRLEGGRIAILCENAAPTIRRNILVNQNITNWGAISLGGDGYATVGASPAVIINNTIVGCANGGISTFSSKAPTIKNNIIAFNNHYGIHREGSDVVAQPDLSYNDVYGNAVSYQEIADPGVGTISADPLFGIGYTLDPTSPCIDAGDPDPMYNDPDGSRNDMGAIPFGEYEPHSPTTLRVPSEYPSIQAAIYSSFDGDTILVAPGIYYEAIYFSGRSIVLLSEDGAEMTIIESPETEPYKISPDNFDTLQTTGNSANSIFNSSNQQIHKDYYLPPLDRSSSAVINMIGNSDSTTLILGFTVDGNNSVRGIYGMEVSPVIKDCIIQNCLGPYDGGGIFMENSAPLIKDNLIRYNVTPISGGAIFIRLGLGFGMAKLSGNIMHNNISGNGPAVSLIEGDDAIIEGNVAYDNVATPGSMRRGAIYVRGINIKVINNTCDNNTVGISVLDTKYSDVRNNIITNNIQGGFENVTDYGLNENLTYDYNDVWNNGVGDYLNLLPGVNDMSLDPMFGLYYHLSIGSPCIDAGDPDPMYNDPDDSRNDMGAFPFEIGYTPGDFNSDGQIDIADLMFMVEYFFNNGPAPVPVELADLNRDGAINIADLVWFVDYIFGPGK